MEEGRTPNPKKIMSKSTARFVVLVKPGGAAPGALLSAVARRGAAATVVAEPPGVMVELASAPVEAVIVVEPARQALLRELLDALRTYYPEVKRWQFACVTDGERVGKEPVLGPIEARYESIEASEPAWQAVRRVQQRVRPLSVKLPAVASEAARSPLISEEELAMLLGSFGENGGLATEPEATAP